MFYEKESTQEGLEQSKSPHLTEQIITSNFFEDEEDNDRDKALDETDFIGKGYFEEDFPWLNSLTIKRLLARINELMFYNSASETEYDNYSNNLVQEQPYILRDLNKEDDSEELPNPLETELNKPEEDEKHPNVEELEQPPETEESEEEEESKIIELEFKEIIRKAA